MIENAETELSFLRCLLDVKRRSELLQLSDELFHRSEYRAFFRAIQAYTRRYSATPSEEAFLGFLDAIKMRPETRSGLVDVYADVVTAPHEAEHYDFLLDRLHDYQEGRQLFKAGRTIQRGLDEGLGFGNVRQEVMRMLKESPHAEAEDIVRFRGFVGRDTELRREAYLAKEAGSDEGEVPWGISFLDKTTGGIFPESLILVYAETGGGKSRFMISVAYNVVQRDVPVMYVSLEMGHDKLKRYWDSRMSMLEHTKIRSGNLGEEERERFFRVLERQRRQDPPFYIVDFPGNFTVRELQEEYDRYCDLEGRKPGLICLDYAGLMHPTRGLHQREDPQGVVFKELYNNFVRVTGTTVLTAVQESRTSKTKKFKEGVHNIGHSAQIAPHCTDVFHLWQTKEDYLKNQLQIIVEKGRDGSRYVRDALFCNWALNYVGDRKVQVASEAA